VTRQPARLALLAAVASAALLTGCAAGFNAQTSQGYAPADGVQADQGDIRVNDALVVVPDDGSTGVINITVVNRGSQPDRITDITSPSGSVELAGDTTLAPGQADIYTATSSPSALMTNVIASPGQMITLKLDFERSAPLTIRTVVEPTTGDYATVTPEATPSA
jgi:hypothetical protein